MNVCKFIKFFLSSSPEFNNQMKQSIDAQMNKLSTNCAQTKQLMRPTSLPQIISMYLIGLHGPDRYEIS